MYVNINRYLKIYLSNPPYTYIGPRANTWELTIDKIDKFEPRNVNDCKTPLILFMFFATFSAFLCYRRKFSASTGLRPKGAECGDAITRIVEFFVFFLIDC